MHELMAIACCDRTAVMAAVSALRELKVAGVQIESAQLIRKDHTGAVLEERAEENFSPPAGTVIGLVLGGAVGALLGGAVGGAAGAGSGGVIGFLRDWYESKVHGDFKADAGGELRSGEYGLLIETKGDPGTALDVTMQQLGGRIALRTEKRTPIRFYKEHYFKLGQHPRAKADG